MKPREFYAARSKGLIKELRESKKVSYQELARRLEAYGVFMTEHVLINRINRGGYSFAFAMMVMDALGVVLLRTPLHEDLHPGNGRDGNAVTKADLPIPAPTRPAG